MPASFPTFTAFLAYLKEYPKMPLKLCAKHLQDLFSFKSESLKTLDPAQIIELKKAVQESFNFLKSKDKPQLAALFIRNH